MLQKGREMGPRRVQELTRALTQLRKAVLDTCSLYTIHPLPILNRFAHEPRSLLVLHESNTGCFYWTRKENQSPAWALGTLSFEHIICWLSKHHSEDKAGHGLSKNRIPCFYFYFSHMRTCCDRAVDVFLTSLFWEGRLRNY